MGAAREIDFRARSGSPPKACTADRLLVCGSLDEAVRAWGPVLEAVPAAVAIYNRDGDVVYQNGLAAAVWPPGPAECLPSVRETLQTARPVRDRQEIVERGAGSSLAVVCNVEPLCDPAGILVGAVCCGRDIIAREALEARLHQSRRIEPADRLTSEVAHHFNNLLTAMLGNLELLELRVAGDPHAIRQVRAAQRSALRGAQLAAQLLAVSRRQPAGQEPADGNAAVHGMSNPMVGRGSAGSAEGRGQG